MELPPSYQPRSHRQPEQLLAKMNTVRFRETSSQRARYGLQQSKPRHALAGEVMVEAPTNHESNSLIPVPEEPMTMKQYTTRPTQEQHTLLPAVQQFTDALTALREKHYSSALSAIKANTQSNLTKLTNLDTNHTARIAELNTLTNEIFPTNISAGKQTTPPQGLGNISLEFRDANGDLKGAATLSDRMGVFARGLAVLQAQVEQLLLARRGIEEEIDVLCALIRVGCERDDVADAVEGGFAATEGEVQELVDASLERWEKMEAQYRRRKVRHGEHLAMILGEGPR